MKVIYINNFLDLEKQYLNKNSSYFIEQELLHSFSKDDLKNLIEITKEEYLKEKLPYLNKIERDKLKMNYKELDELSQYFIDLINYFFAWWEELEISKSFLDKLERTYRLNFESKNFRKKEIDIYKIPIREILSFYIKVPDNLKRNLKCFLPKHKDKTASLRIYENTNSFYCFGCWKSWNILNLIAEMEWITTKEAYKKLLNLY